MTHRQDDHDFALREALRDAAPPAPFDRNQLRDRIERSLGIPPDDRRHAPFLAGRPRRWLSWSARAAAAALVFALGAWYGRLSASPAAGTPAAAGATAAVTSPGRLPLSIQSNGTGYVASLAQLSEMRDRLTPAERAQARQVALAVLSGAIAELAAEGDGRLPRGVLQTVLRYGVPADGSDLPVVRYP